MYSFRFLVVDSTPKARTFIANTIKNELECPNAAMADDMPKALKVLEAGNIDVVVADSELQVGSGLELLKTIREDESLKSTPFLLTTGNPSADLIKGAMELKVNQIIVKPFSAGDLEKKLREICSGVKPKTPSSGGGADKKKGGVSEISWNKA